MKVLSMPTNEELTHQEAAKYVGLSSRTLYEKNNRGEGPRHVRRFGRLRYYRSDLDAFKKANEEVREAYSS